MTTPTSRACPSCDGTARLDQLKGLHYCYWCARYVEQAEFRREVITAIPPRNPALRMSVKAQEWLGRALKIIGLAINNREE